MRAASFPQGSAVARPAIGELDEQENLGVRKIGTQVSGKDEGEICLDARINPRFAFACKTKAKCIFLKREAKCIFLNHKS
jgi:hypothetical protein